ncbi:hypothetical protein BDF19DRAFT_437582 [Syncephalis fuscata]|nr:hypothetical protein BDF19DRAFT_437582 [Syncephalis fuscata]
MSNEATMTAEQQQLTLNLTEIRKSFETMLLEYGEVVRGYLESCESTEENTVWQPNTKTLSRVRARWEEIDEQSAQIEAFLELMKKALLEQQVAAMSITES